MDSQACKHGEHDLCHPSGKVKQSSGKTIRCACSCHKDVETPTDRY